MTAPHTPVSLRADADRAGGALPPLLAEARRLAAMIPGEHGRRRAGPGEMFWQYRPAVSGDPLSSIDWRRSARSDDLYVRQTEHETAQTVWIWRDASAAMGFSSGGEAKSRRAAVLALATAALLVRGGERFAQIGGDPRPLRGEMGLNRLALSLTEAVQDPPDYGAPPPADISRGGKALFLSDFFGDLDATERGVAAAASRGAAGALVQVNDPAEEAFPYRGRVLFESMSGGLRYDAERAESLADAYKRRLAARRDRLADIARRYGWRFLIHRTDQSAAAALLWIATALGDPRRMGG